MPNFLETGLSNADILRFLIFQLVKMAAAAILNFWNCEILLAIWVERVETHQHTKFRQNWSIGCEGIKIFRFFKMAATTISDCQIRELLMDDTVWWAKTNLCTDHHCYSWQQNTTRYCTVLQYTVTFVNWIKIRLQFLLLLFTVNDDKVALILWFAVHLGIGPVLVLCHQMIATLRQFLCIDTVDSTSVSATTDFLTRIAKQYNCN